jgi:MerR family transcriptional regulator, thiopeptide resistance regulator
MLTSLQVITVMYTVGKVAQLAGVSVRTLHHYDSLGLVKPSERSAAGYRLYSMSDLERLQQVMFYKELGFGLRHILELMSCSTLDRRQEIISQRKQIEKRTLKLRAMLCLIDRTLRSLEEGNQMTPEEMFVVFGDFDPYQYEDEVRQRWGRKATYRESVRRTKSYNRKDWETIRDENDAIMEHILDVFDRGIDPHAPEAMDVAEEARLAIDRAFYPCSHAMHVLLSEGYVNDPRFRSFYDRKREGFAVWFAAAIGANANRIPAEE